MHRALALQARAEYRLALQLYADIGRHYPKHADVMHNAGLANLLIGRHGAAEQLLLRALELRPESQPVRSTLVKLWTLMDRSLTLAEIAKDGRWIAALDFDSCSKLGGYFYKRKDYDLARVALARAAELSPSDAGARHLLGVALLQLSAAEDAEPHLREALRLMPSEPEVHVDLARCLFSMHLKSKHPGLWGEGRELIETALRLAPTNVQLHHEMGLVYEQEGDFSAAKLAYEQALSVSPGYAPALISLAAVLRKDAPQSLLEQLTATVEAMNDAQGAETSRAYQVLGKCFDARGEFARAFACFEKANGARVRGRTYDRLAHERYVDNLIETYSRETVERMWPAAAGLERPIFIVGMPRSGTTLLEHMLAGHPQIEPAGEVPYFTALERANRALHDVTGTPSPHWDERISEQYRQGLRAQFDAILSDAGGEARFVTDKMPFNFAQLGMITYVYPGARIIHCKRNALDVGLSCFIETFGDNHSWSLSLRGIGHYYRQYARLMSHWTELFAGRILEVNYEDMTRAPEVTLRAVLNFLDAGWNEEWASYLDSKRSIRTPSNWQVRQPIYTSSLGRAEQYRDQLGPLIEALE
ncbi:tetratricopeptide repeat-containing sulfotransferase family protein [Steroidobacter sp.]|uniref:tetratricopeptide repeat-containing sulfotransferase family protein n=1 Tax=Steroidobacter sp. TaxID=1978227 RepID=UPI0025FE2276|nr:sulfotransferase [Steroidobacter sp.]